MAQVKVTSVSMSQQEYEALRRDAFELRLSVSAFMRGLHKAYREAKQEKRKKDEKRSIH